MNSENCKEKSTSSPPTPAQLFDSSMLLCQTNLLCDHHSSEEELEVINGPCSGNEVNDGHEHEQNLHSLPSEDELFGDDDGSGDNNHDHHHNVEDKALSSSSPSRPRSNMLEIRKRSLAHSSDEEVNIIEPVNFCTSPPLEALKPNHRSRIQRATTPLILAETRCGIENMKLCDNDLKHQQQQATTNNGDNDHHLHHHSKALSIKPSSSSHQIYEPSTSKYHHFRSSSSAGAGFAGGTGAIDIEVRSVSPPAKLFHCAISPKRRPMRTHHAPQRLQRPHRPCLDFDKMQQLKDSSVTGGEMSTTVYCW
ncbi:hypothetical protein ACFFRR_004454 [Megaselia abdita]